MLLLGTILRRHGWPVTVFDQRVHRQWQTALLDTIGRDPLLLGGITAMTGPQIHHGLEIARFLRTQFPALPLVWGGVHVSLLPEQSLAHPLVDYVIVGENEGALPELCAALATGSQLDHVANLGYHRSTATVINPPRPFVALSTLPEIDWSLLEINNYVDRRRQEFDIGETSRGCPRHCTFCYNHAFHHHTWRADSAERVVARMFHFACHLSVSSLWLRDDNFFVDWARVAAICDGLRHGGFRGTWHTSGMHVATCDGLADEQLRVLRASGFTAARFGVESGSPRLLRLLRKDFTVEQVLRVNKRCAATGITPIFNFIGGLPTETQAELNATLQLMRRLKSENPGAIISGLSLYAPYPGTELFARASAGGFLIPQQFDDWAEYSYFRAHQSLPVGARRRLENINDITWFISDSAVSCWSLCMYLLTRPLAWWLRLRWTRSWFSYAPELRLLRKLRRWLGWGF